MTLTMITAQHENDAIAYTYAAGRGLLLPARHAPGSDLLHLDPACRHTEPRETDRRDRTASNRNDMKRLECDACMPPPPAGTTLTWDKVLRAVSEIERTDRAVTRADAYETRPEPDEEIARITVRTLMRWPNHTAALPQRDLTGTAAEMGAALIWVREWAEPLDAAIRHATGTRRWTPIITDAWGRGDNTSPALVMVDRPRGADPQGVLMQKMLHAVAFRGSTMLATGPRNLIRGIPGVTDARIAELDDRPVDEQLPAALIDHLLHTWHPGVVLQDLLTGLRAAAL